MKEIILTGIKPTGEVHIGNYLGAIKPALKLAEEPEYKATYFVADHHALTNPSTANEFRHLSYGIAATWLALGLNPEKSIFYRQSDIPEIFELNWILSCFSPKGSMNRAHAYKSLVDKNQKSEKNRDEGINMGLYNYPILMAADILMFKSAIVPVGKDQIQHIEIARDIAINFNNKYGNTFKIPNFKVQESSSIIPGLDGRKMSKSYNNTIPLFLEENKLKKNINRITTNSLPPEARKNYEDSILFTLYKEFASLEEIENMKQQYINGIGWGEVKNELFIQMNNFLKEPREKYLELISNPKQIDKILQEGAEKARELSIPFLKEVKAKIGFIIQ